MARKSKKGSKKTEEKERRPIVDQRTKEWVIGVSFFVLALFLILSQFGGAGIAGDTIYSFLEMLVGSGYFMFPALLFVLSYIFIKDDEGIDENWAKAIGALILFIAGLGLVSVAFPDRGGIIGDGMAKPLITFFDVAGSSLLLGGIALVGIVIVFKDSLEELIARLGEMSWRKERDEEEYEEEEIEPVVVARQGMQQAETDEEDEAEAPRREPLLSGLTGKKKDREELAEAVNRFELSGKPYVAPPLSLLKRDSGKPGVGDIKANSNLIKRTLQNFGINVEMDEITIGPTVTRYALKPAEGVRLQKIVGLQTNLELALAAHPVRIEAPIPGKSLVGVEVPNLSKATVGLAELIGAKDFSESEKPLLFALGRGISGRSYYADLAKAPHMLVAGATGSGKSVSLHAIITSLIYRNGPQSLKFIMVDPKRVELSLYNGIPHLITPVITNAKKTVMALKWAVKEMDRRYEILEKEGRQSITSYHDQVVKPALERAKSNPDAELPDSMPYIVIVIDELGDLMQLYPKEIEAEIIRLAQMSRAVGIHLILTTQRPSKQVITGLIKANVPTRIALQVASNMESRIILDSGGAEHLLGAGDMLYQSADMSKPARIQSAFITEKEVKGVASFLAKEYASELPEEVNMTAAEERNSIFETDISRDDDEEGDNDDSMYEEAREAVMKAGKASTSYLQRRLRIGYSRAARIMDMLEQEGVIGPQDGSRPRDVLIQSDDATPAE